MGCILLKVFLVWRKNRSVCACVGDTRKVANNQDQQNRRKYTKNTEDSPYFWANPKTRILFRLRVVRTSLFLF